MAKEIILNGTFDNDPSAEKIRLAFDKVNANFTELFNAIGVDSFGDMVKLMYDPDGVEANVFNMLNMVESASKKILTNTERVNFQEAFNWGDHGSENYLKSFTEVDPVFVAWRDANIVKVESFVATAGQTLKIVTNAVIVDNGLWTVQVGTELWNSTTGITGFIDGLITINFATGAITFNSALQAGQHVIIKYN